MKKNTVSTRIKRKMRMFKKIRGVSARPRVAVFRSHHYLYAQIIDDEMKKTLVSAHDREIGKTEKNKLVRASTLGKVLAEKAKAQKIAAVVFDRSGYTYHGRIKALAQGLREGGLKF